MLAKEPAEYPKLDKDEASNEALLRNPESNESSSPLAPPPQKVVLFSSLPAQVCDLKWWLTKSFGDHLDIVNMYSEMGNDERTEMQLKFHDLPNPSVFVTTLKVGGIVLNHTAANHAVMTQKFGVLNEQRQAFERDVCLGQTEFRTHGYSTLDPIVMITEWVISTRSLVWLHCESYMVWWTDRTRRRRWYTGFWSVGTIIGTSLQSMEILRRQVVRMNDDYQGSEIKVPLFNHSTNTIPPTDAK